MSDEAAISPPRAKSVEYGFPSPQALHCTVCGRPSWLCPHPWELREPGAEWEAFARGLPWKKSVAKTAPAEATRASVTLDDSEMFPTATAAAPVAPEPMRVRVVRLDDAPPAPRNRHYLCGCTILFTDPWLWKILGFPESHQQGCLYAENERFVASCRVPAVVAAPRAVIERPAPKTPQKRIVVSLALDLPK